MPAHKELAEQIFLLPNATFIAELVAFVIILAVLARYILPPLQKAMRERQLMIAQQAKDADDAKAKLAEAQDAYKNALTEARVEAAEIRESARAEAQRAVEEMRAAGMEEQARIVARGEEQLTRQRSAIVRELRAEVGTLAVELSEKIIKQRLADDDRVRQTVDAFIAGLRATDAASDAANPERAGTSPADAPTDEAAHT